MVKRNSDLEALVAETRRPPSGRPPAEWLKVCEIFYSLQGESTYCGRPCVLIRLVGCQMRCRWCDSEYSFHGGHWFHLEDVLREVASYGCGLVELTGGEPLLQPAARPLLQRLCEEGHEVLLETGGGVDIAGIDPRVHRIVDVKCPGSGESNNNLWSNMELLGPRDEVKFVLADRDDYLFARGVIAQYHLESRCAILLSVVFGELEAVSVAEWLLEDGLAARLQVQLHKILWGPQRIGV